MCRHVQVNAVAPGVIGDSGTHRYAKEVVEGAIEKIPLKRHGKAVEVAYLATFLASPMASYITGQVYALPTVLQSPPCPFLQPTPTCNGRYRIDGGQSLWGDLLNPHSMARM